MAHKGLTHPGRWHNYQKEKTEGAMRFLTSSLKLPLTTWEQITEGQKLIFKSTWVFYSVLKQSEGWYNPRQLCHYGNGRKVSNNRSFLVHSEYDLDGQVLAHTLKMSEFPIPLLR